MRTLQVITSPIMATAHEDHEVDRIVELGEGCGGCAERDGSSHFNPSARSHLCRKTGMNTHRRHLSPAERSRSRSAAKSTPLPATSISAAASPYVVKFSQDFGWADPELWHLCWAHLCRHLHQQDKPAEIYVWKVAEWIAERRHAQEFPDRASSQSSKAYMRTEMNGPAKDERMMAVLDTGCREDRLQPKGWGGRWQQDTNLPEDVELENSDVPLLLSAGAQQRLGLVIDMGNHTIYSRTLKELELIVHNGLIVCLPLHFLENLDWAISCWTPRSGTTSGTLSRMTTPFPMTRPSNMTWCWRMRTMKWTKEAVTTCRSLRERLRFRRASNFKNPWTKWRRRTVPWGLDWERSTEDEDVAMQVLGGNICLCYLTCWAFRQPSTMTATTLEEIQSGPPGEVDWGRRCLLALFGAGLWTMEQVAVCQHVRKIKFHNLLICYLWWTLV